MALETTNISVTDVSQTIREYIYDDFGAIIGYSTDVGTLCKSAKVNKWSRYKPVDGAWPGITLGFEIASTNATKPAKSHFTQWVYKPPTGGSTSPFRLGDFRGYDHDSTTLLQKATNMGVTFFGTQTAGNDIKVSCDFGDYATLASIKNMTKFADCYLGLAVYKGTTIGYLNPVWFQCGTAKIGSNAGELITISASDVPLADKDIIEIVPFISEYTFMNDSVTAGNQNKYSLSATKENDNVLFQFIGNLPTVAWYPIYNSTSSDLTGIYGLVVKGTAISQRLTDITESNLKIRYKLWDGVNGTGVLVYDGSSDSRMVAVPSFVIPALGSITIPQTTVAWGSVPNINTVKSVEYWYHVYGSTSHNHEIINF